MSKPELKNYYRWFFEVLPGRISDLAQAVRETPGFEGWQPDETPESLDDLGSWFATQVKTRQRTEDERQEIAAGSAYAIQIPAEELTDRTFALARDVGMYLSQVLLKNHPSLHWEQRFGSKKFIDYGQPVLVGFGSAPFNPVRVAVTLAYGLVNQRERGNRLRAIYHVWSTMAQSQA